MKKILCLVLISLLVTSSFVNAGGWSFNNSSSWAQDELTDAMINQISVKEYDDYLRDITRKEFAELIMNLYAQVMGKLPEPASRSTFTDTEDENILMAYTLGVINGKGNRKFAPNDAVTRQEVAVMLKRAIDVMGVSFKKSDGILTISDKDKVATWAKDGVDFVFENGFMTGYMGNFDPLNTTPVEQGVVLVNRVFEKNNELLGSLEPNDYTKGYTTQVTDKGIQVTYKNNGQSEIVISFTEPNPEKDATVRSLKGAKDVKTIEEDLSKIYFVDSNDRLWNYDFHDGTCFQYTTSKGGALNVKDYKVIASDQYYGYIAVESIGRVSQETNIYAFDRDGIHIGELEMMTDLNYQIGEIYTEIDEKSNKFAIQVTDAIGWPGEIFIDEDLLQFFSNANHTFYQENGVGYLKMSPYYYDSDAFSGPIGMAGTSSGNQFKYNGYGGIYQVDMTFNNESGNAGILFNLVNASDGNDNYRGYYVGINPEKDTVMFGKSFWKWIKIKEVSLGFDVEQDDTVTLKVIKNGTNIEVYVNGEKFIDVTDDSLSEDAGFGVRTWKSDVTYSDYTITPLPY